MGRTFRAATACLGLALACGCAGLPSPTVADRSQHRGSDALHAEAVRELGAVKFSVYAHRTRIDETNGTFEYDCSGFVNYALSRTNPGALETLRRAGRDRPTAS